MTTDITNCNKITVTISTEEMWRNYMQFITDISLDEGFDKVMADAVSTAAAAILVPDIDFGTVGHILNLRNLFKRGDTAILIGDAISYFDTLKDVLREVVVTQGDKKIVVRHTDINF
jgi:hypothetical protein